MHSSLLLIGIIIGISSLLIVADVPGDLIGNLPGYGPTPSKQYSGFLPADTAQTVFLHYWFVTASTVDPATAPVAVWMNGGPGCSSLEGLLYELGPFTFTGNVVNGIPTLMDNPYGWTTISNVIFIEQPAGVGFSYAVNGSSRTDDYVQSQNTYGFLLSFFKAYAEFAKNPFFITGESYAGIYVPTLANRIVDGNAAGNPYINLKGIAVGDGCMGNSIGTCGDGPDATQISVDFFFGHGMISQLAYTAINAACGNWINPPNNCYNLADAALNQVGNIDVYNIYDVCGNDNVDLNSSSTVLSTLSHRVPASSRIWKAPNKVLANHLKDPVICVPTALSTQYMDNTAVRAALHLSNSSLNSWGECYGISYRSNLDTLIPTYPKLIANMNVLIYSGDADACVPWNGSYNWTRNLGLKETVAWRPWSVNADGRAWTAGFVTSWGTNFSFITIKHAGHMVPQFEPEAGYVFYAAFLKGNIPN